MISEEDKEKVKQLRLSGMSYKKDITLMSLYKRNMGVCYLCGEKCDYSDYVIRNGTVICGDWYSSIDHIVPVSKGGEHSWKNVKLAHRRCNYLKRDRI